MFKSLIYRLLGITPEPKSYRSTAWDASERRTATRTESASPWVKKCLANEARAKELSR